MSVENFIPEVWSAALLQHMNDALVFGQAGVINRNYEGDISQAGDTVHITQFDKPEIRSYTKNSDITWDTLSSTQQSMTVDQANYFALTVDDIDRRQALTGFVEQSTQEAGFELAAGSDGFLASLMASEAGNTLDAVTVGEAQGDAYQVLVDLRTALARTNTPDQGRFVVVPPEVYGVLLGDDRFIRADAAGTTEGLRNGVVGRAAGFDVIESNRVAGDGEAGYTVIAGHGVATTYAEQIVSTEALRREGSFADGIRGLHLYGAKVVRPDNLATVTVTA